MVSYTVTLTAAEDKALHIVALSAEEWINNAVHERCRIAIDEIVTQEIQRRLAAGESISGTKDEIILSSNIDTAEERNRKLSEQAHPLA